MHGVQGPAVERRLGWWDRELEPKGLEDRDCLMKDFRFYCAGEFIQRFGACGSSVKDRLKEDPWGLDELMGRKHQLRDNYN